MAKKQLKPSKKARWPDSHLFELKRRKKIQGVLCAPGHYFWNEAEVLGGGPYGSRADALAGLNEYCRWLDERQRPSELPGKFTRSPAMGSARRKLCDVQADLTRLQDLTKADLVMLAIRMREALIVVAAGIWRNKEMNACGLTGESGAVHAVEEALNYLAPSEKILGAKIRKLEKEKP